MVLGKDDGLAEPVASRHLDAVAHQVFQHLVHRVHVEQPVVQSRRIDLLRHAAGLLVPELLLVLGLFLRGEFVVLDPFPLELERHGMRLGRHQEAVRHRLFQFVVKGGDTLLQFEELVGVAVHLGAWRGGQPQQQGIEILEDGAELLVDRAVGLVDHDQVEMAGAEALVAPPWPRRCSSSWSDRWRARSGWWCRP